MIFESHPWRDELVRSADRLQRRLTQKRWPEQSFYLVERDLLVGAFAIRRLVDSFKVPDSLVTSSFPVTWYPRVGSLPDIWNRFEIWELFDLTQPDERTLELVALCNKLIHSFVFQLGFSESGETLETVFIASDRDRRYGLFQIQILTLIAIFRTVAHEDVVSSRSSRLETGEMIYTELKGPRDFGEGHTADTFPGASQEMRLPDVSLPPLEEPFL